MPHSTTLNEDIEYAFNSLDFSDQEFSEWFKSEVKISLELLGKGYEHDCIVTKNAGNYKLVATLNKLQSKRLQAYISTYTPEQLKDMLYNLLADATADLQLSPLPTEALHQITANRIEDFSSRLSTTRDLDGTFAKMASLLAYDFARSTVIHSREDLYRKFKHTLLKNFSNFLELIKIESDIQIMQARIYRHAPTDYKTIPPRAPSIVGESHPANFMLSIYHELYLCILDRTSNSVIEEILKPIMSRLQGHAILLHIAQHEPHINSAAERIREAFMFREHIYIDLIVLCHTFTTRILMHYMQQNGYASMSHMILEYNNQLILDRCAATMHTILMEQVDCYLLLPDMPVSTQLDENTMQRVRSPSLSV